MMSGEQNDSAAAAAEPERSEEKKAQKEAKAAAKKAEKEAKKLKAAEKKKKVDADKSAQEANAGKKAEAKAQAKAKADAKAAEVEAKVQQARNTPVGEKKNLSQQPPDSYHPRYVEAAWYDWWDKQGYFRADPASDAEPFVIVIPPPNVTGALHIGHALTDAVEDAVIRFQRMKGRNALWVPGTDHAGIATQTVVEKKLMRERGQTRHDLGRDTFIKEVYTWVEDYGGRIWAQQRRLGISVEWERQAFTMDDNLSRAVLEAFVRFHKDGLIYRDNRLVNWCCKLRTAVSDIEVDYIDVESATLLPVPGYDAPVEFGVIISFAYPMEDGDAEIVVATTRIETMLGDVAVAVHPDDKRYEAYHGKFAVHPVNGRRIPIILDAELVDMSFGTGAVKITPAHDPNDYKTGQRHGLDMINIFDDNGCINEHGGEFEGQPRFTARANIVKFLQDKDLHRGKADNKMALPQCSRSKDIIEPMLKPQWWVDCNRMAADAAAVARDGRLEIIPKEFEAVWYRWLDNIRDWCISRQLWWGHQIPAWYVVMEGEAEEDSGLAGAPSERSDRWVVARSEVDAQKVAAAKFPGKSFKLSRDEDVLDTWFSSGLFPFSVFGWPENSPDLAKFYPNALLETGHDILFFWVARMVMMGMQLTGKVPFKQVYLHAMVRDAHGRKMSKSLGNVINPTHVIEGISLAQLHAELDGGNLDPREAAKAKEGQSADFPEGIEECGTDALRFALCSYTAQGRDMNLDIKRVVAYRHWCNKLWNAIKFVMLSLGDAFVPSLHKGTVADTVPFACRWILSRLHATCATVNSGLETYDFSTTTQCIYSFWQYDVCDYFIELLKPILRGDNEAEKSAARQTIFTALEAGLRLLHPFMPFLTEELWQRLPRRPDEESPTIVRAAFPTASWCGCDDAAAEDTMTRLQAIVKEVRALRTAKGLKPGQKADLIISCSDTAVRRDLEAQSHVVATMVGSCDSCSLLAPAAPAPAGSAVAVVDASTTLYLPLAGLLDPVAEASKLEKQRGSTASKLTALQQRLEMPGYEKTPDNRKAIDAEKVRELEEELSTLGKALKEMQGLCGSA